MNENDNRKNQTPRRKTFLQTFFGEDATPAALAKQYGVPVLLAVYALFAVFAMPHCTHLKDAPSEDASFAPPSSVTAAPKATATPKPTPTPEPKEPTFTNATLAYAGDLVVHMGLNEEASTPEGYDFKPLMEGAIPYVQDADYAFCCFETTFPIEGDISGYPTFHSPVSLAANLKEAGFDLVETANNHCMDARKEGLDNTLDVLDAAGLDHVGTYRTQDERDQNHGIVVKDLNGIRIAFLSYTYGTNCFPVTDFPYAANIFFSDYLELYADDIDELDLSGLDRDIAAAKDLHVDMIAVFMHWGLEYHTAPVDYQMEVADHLFAQGVDLVLGGHPHVPEPMETRTVRGADGKEHTGYLCYCMGNFLSCMNDHYTNLTGVTTLELEKNVDTGETYLKNVSYAPLIMVDTADHGVMSTWRYKIVDLHKSIDSYAAGDSLGFINDTLYNDMLTALSDIHSIWGANFDRFDPSYTANTEGEMPAKAPTSQESPS